MEESTIFIIGYLISVFVSMTLFIYVNYDEGHDLDICILGQMFLLGMIPLVNLFIAVTVFMDNLDIKIDCSKVILLKGKSRD